VPIRNSATQRAHCRDHSKAYRGTLSRDEAPAVMQRKGAMQARLTRRFGGARLQFVEIHNIGLVADLGVPLPPLEKGEVTRNEFTRI